ncbi:MAG: DMT family transporter [Alphaproteobacteria bacterium]|jgi:S-adenosylmethionine uptake transporter|nr:DMT family transporter [Alphaproteobacteria bacterium]
MGILLSFLAYSSFAFMDTVNKFLFSSIDISFFSYMFWLDSAILTALIIIGLFTSRLSLSIFKTKKAFWVFVRSLLSVGNTLCSLIAISHLPFHIFYSLAFMQPIIATLLSIFLFIERPNLRKIVLIILGFIGVLISIQIWDLSHSGFALIGILGGLGIAITGALSGIVVKKYLPTENTITIAIYNILLSMLVALGYFAFTGEKLFLTDNINTITLIALGGIFCALGMIFFMMSYQKGAVQSIVSMQYIQIIWGVLFGFILFATVPSLPAIIGVAIIMIANYINIKISK